MRSIKEQREELSINCDSTNLYDHIGNDYEELLDWAERAREYILGMIPVLGHDGLGLAEGLLKELPKE